jgi:uncharacterized protein
MSHQNVGVHTTEKVSGPVITGAQYGVAGFVGVTRRGPIDKFVDVTSWTDFVRKCGGFYQDNYLPLAIREFFREEKGAVARIARVLTDDPISPAERAENTFKGIDGSNDSLTVKAKYFGNAGNDISIENLKYDALITEDLETDATEISLSSVVNVEVGDFVRITSKTDSSNFVYFYVQDIVPAARKIKFESVGTISTIPSGSIVECATTHLAKTKLVNNLVSNATSALLDDATGINVGSLVYIGEFGEDEIEVIVTARSGNTIYFDDIGSITTINAEDSIVASIEFSIRVLDQGEYVQEFHGLSMEDMNEIGYIEEILSGPNNQSDWISLEDENYVETDFRAEAIPILKNAILLNGADGALVDEDDIIGSDTVPKTGIHLFDGVDMDYVCAPGYSSVAGKNLSRSIISWTKSRKDLVHIHSHPLQDVSPEAIRNHKSKLIGYPSSYSAMYSPWLETQHPTRSGRTIFQPPDGWVCAEAAFVARTMGLQFAPANTILAGDIVGMSMELGNSDANILAILNNEGINVIRHFEGEGYRIYGARTSSLLQNGFHLLNIRVYVNWLKRTISSFLRSYAIRPNMQTFRGEIEESLYDFLEGEWELGRLVPEDNISDAFYIQCNSENNPRRIVDAGRMIVDAGVQPPPPAEFINFNIALFKGGNVSISESTIQTA